MDANLGGVGARKADTELEVAVDIPRPFVST